MSEFKLYKQTDNSFPPYLTEPFLQTPRVVIFFQELFISSVLILLQPVSYLFSGHHFPYSNLCSKLLWGLSSNFKKFFCFSVFSEENGVFLCLKILFTLLKDKQPQCKASNSLQSSIVMQTYNPTTVQQIQSQRYAAYTITLAEGII